MALVLVLPLAARADDRIYYGTRAGMHLTTVAKSGIGTANAVIRLTGWEHSFIPGRIVALAAGLAIAAVIAITVYRHTRRVEIGMLGAAVFLLSLPAVEWRDALGDFVD